MKAVENRGLGTHATDDRAIFETKEEGFLGRLLSRLFSDFDLGLEQSELDRDLASGRD